jgi:hypothetical protein
MPDRRTDYEARERIERLHAAYVAFARRVFVALTIITLAVVASLALAGLLIQENRDRAKDIQSQRKTAILADCQAQNARHDGATNALIDGAGQDERNAPTEAAKAEIRRRRDVTLGLIDALAPKVDCVALVRRSVHPD